MKKSFERLFTRISNLITIKSIVTLILTIVFAILSLRGTITEDVFISVFTIVIGFYFGTQKIDDTSKVVSSNNNESTEENENDTVG
jgi:hypothetical protein